MQFTIIGKQLQLIRIAARINRLNRSNPASALRIVKLAKRKKLTLKDALSDAEILHDIPVTVSFPVFAANSMAKKHEAIH